MWLDAVVDRSNRIYRNGYGLTDMVGNVTHWCLDFGGEYYQVKGLDPVNKVKGRTREARGGSWYVYTATDFRCSLGSSNSSDYQNDMFGFRLVAKPK